MTALPGIQIQEIQETEIPCPECGAAMVLRQTSKFSYKDGSKRPFYGCSTWPHCTATHGAHPDGRPLGIPANKETKEARIEAHTVFDDLWRSGRMRRPEAYRYLAGLMGRDEVHFGEFSKEECEEAIRLLEERVSD